MKPATKASLLLGLLASMCAWALEAQTNSFSVVIDPPIHGTLQLSPPLPADGKYPAGTILTLTAQPDAGYVLDSVWYSVPGRFGQMYHEGTTREFRVTIDQDKRLGASFIEESAVNHIS